ncbi:hypothetical protein AAFF_G00353140 [Aldrovandia affinis]|uniref:SH3 domain-binding protein 5 n=1 Tax=Aldrovandia affinis TaxID=143900 RepID=A0AAD7R5N9_9TELE|nr:hypothetical protein AAFF_G00353140 [Aldrovandia affinis]
MDNLEKGNRSEEDSESPEEEEVDPRIQGELEKLNQSTDDINRCETELEDARQRFRSVLVEATVQLDELVKKIGKAVESPNRTGRPGGPVSQTPPRSGLMTRAGLDARQRFRSVLVEATVQLDELVKKIGKAVEESKPYWEARRGPVRRAGAGRTDGCVSHQLLGLAQLEAHRAAQEFQRATEVLRAAKETIALAEQRLLEEDKRHFDSAWQEMLNHATQRVMEAEQTKSRSELVHKDTAEEYNAAMSRMKQLEKKLKRTISKSRPYFELKAKYYLQLEVCAAEEECGRAAGRPDAGQGGVDRQAALRSLETISDEIHERRRSCAMGPRGRGVGAEGNAPHDITNFRMEADDITNFKMEADDITNFKMESDGISMASESFEDENCGSTISLDLPSPTSLSPILGPRSECSGASSPDCDLERGDRAEGAESELNVRNNNTANQKRALSLEGRFGRLSVQRTKTDGARSAERERFSLSRPPAPRALLFNGV